MLPASTALGVWLLTIPLVRHVHRSACVQAGASDAACGAVCKRTRWARLFLRWRSRTAGAISGTKSGACISWTCRKGLWQVRTDENTHQWTCLLSSEVTSTIPRRYYGTCQLPTTCSMSILPVEYEGIPLVHLPAHRRLRRRHCRRLRHPARPGLDPTQGPAGYPASWPPKVPRLFRSLPAIPFYKL